MTHTTYCCYLYCIVL